MKRRELLVSAVAAVGGGYTLWDIGVISAPDEVNVSSNEATASSESRGESEAKPKTQTQTPIGDPVWSRTARLTHNEINSFRSANGRETVRWSPALNDMATAWAERMADQDTLKHRPDLTAGAEKHGVMCNRIGENVGQTYVNENVETDSGVETYRTPEQLATGLLEMWQSSEEHRQNMLREQYTQSGVGVVVDGLDRVWAVQNFC